ncbi:MAG TPA: hypothetical protein VF045_05245 [Acidimicrobiales bacterium]
MAVYIGEDGVLCTVEVAGHPGPTDLEVTVPSAPIAAFGDEEFRERLRPWAAGG